MEIKDYSSDLKNIRKQLNYDSIGRIRITSGRGQYKGLRWIKCYFKDDCKLKEPYKDVKGFHIMPYRIMPEHVKKAVPSVSQGEFKNQENSFTDYDITTGNIHICPNSKRQLVLLVNNGTEKRPKYNGPGWKVTPDGKLGTSNIKTNFYFPPIGSDSSDDLFDLINSMLEAVKE